MLTKQQKKLLLFIESFQKEMGISPSFDEMRHAMQQKSKSSIHTLLSGLVERGFIRKLNNRARALEIIKHPDLSLNTPSFLVAESKSPPPQTEEVQSDGIATIPFFGAQSTVFAAKLFLSNPQQILSVPRSFLGLSSKNASAIQIKGDSLKELSILDGDMLFFNDAPKAKNGEIVLAVTPDEMVHIRRFDVKDGKVLLSTQSKYMMPEAFEEGQIKVVGLLVGLSRKL